MFSLKTMTSIYAFLIVIGELISPASGFLFCVVVF